MFTDVPDRVRSAKVIVCTNLKKIFMDHPPPPQRCETRLNRTAREGGETQVYVYFQCICEGRPDCSPLQSQKGVSAYL